MDGVAAVQDGVAVV
jgi:hypothetical protein